MLKKFPADIREMKKDIPEYIRPENTKRILSEELEKELQDPQYINQWVSVSFYKILAVGKTASEVYGKAPRGLLFQIPDPKVAWVF